MATLNDILNQLPRVLRHRYSDTAFWAERADDILLELAQKADLEDIKSEYCLELVDKQSDYNIPSYMLKTLEVYEKTTDNYQPNYLRQITSSVRGSRIRLANPFTISPVTDTGIILGTGTGQSIGLTETVYIYDNKGTYASGSTYIDNDLVLFSAAYYKANQAVATSESPTTNPEKWDLLEDDDLNGYMIEFTSGLNNGYNSVIEKFTASTGACRLRTPLIRESVATDDWKISDTFLILEYIKGFRISDPDNLDANSREVLDISSKVINVLRHGLRYYGELQAEGLTKEVQKFEVEYEKRKREYIRDNSRGSFRQDKKLASLNKGSFTVQGNRFA